MVYFAMVNSLEKDAEVIGAIQLENGEKELFLASFFPCAVGEDKLIRMLNQGFTDREQCIEAAINLASGGQGYGVMRAGEYEAVGVK